MKQAVILAGGKGTRLATLLKGLPKPLVDVAGTPLLERQVLQLASQGIQEVVILVNYAAEMIAAYFSDRHDLGVRIRLIDDGEPRGTAGSVLAVLDELHDEFLVVYGDTLFNIDIKRFIEHHRSKAADATLFLHPNDHPEDSDLVETNGDGRVTAFHPYPHAPGSYHGNLVNGAFYALKRRALRPWSDFPSPSDFGKDLFPQMILRGMHLAGYRSFEYIKDLGTPSRLAKVEKDLREGVVERASIAVAQKVVFVDRDGTLNVPRGFIARADDFELIPGAARALRQLNEHEYRVVVITNQPVIARGECSFDELRRIHGKLDTLLAREHAFIDGLFVCPHHPNRGFVGEIAALKIDCNCRKPKTGLVDAAAKCFNADLKRSWFVGDSARDIETARRSNLRSILVRTGEAGRNGACAPLADFECADMAEAVGLIVERDLP